MTTTTRETLSRFFTYEMDADEVSALISEIAEEVDYNPKFKVERGKDGFVVTESRKVTDEAIIEWTADDILWDEANNELGTKYLIEAVRDVRLIHNPQGTITFHYNVDYAEDTILEWSNTCPSCGHVSR